MKEYLVDTTAMIVFSTLLGAFVEIIVSRLEPCQSLRIRLAAIPAMVVTGRSYGLYRDYLFKRFVTAPAGRLAAIVIDTIANATFQLPLYLSLLAWGGASLRQMLVAGTSILIIAAVSGRPYGIFLSRWRKVMGASSAP
jgi:hypothetical protein